MTSPTLVVTVSFHSTSRIRPMVESIRSGYAPVDPILIANNAPGDHELTDYVATATGVQLIEIGRNAGYGAAINEAVARGGADRDWILVANPDLTFAPSALSELLRVGESDPSVGSVGPRVITPSGETYPSARRLPSLRTGIGHALFSRLWPANPWTTRYLSDREDPPTQRDAGWLSGACVMVRRTAFEQIGGFDEKFFMYFEDVDLGARLSRAGWRNVYVPSAEVTHEGGHSTKASSRHMVRVHHRSAYLYLAAKYNAWYLWPLRVALRVGLFVRAQFARS